MNLQYFYSFYDQIHFLTLKQWKLLDLIYSRTAKNFFLLRQDRHTLFRPLFAEARLQGNACHDPRSFMMLPVLSFQFNLLILAMVIYKAWWSSDLDPSGPERLLARSTPALDPRPGRYAPSRIS
jgi:hypothetical protein